MSTLGRFEFYHAQQGGGCYLMITDACRAHAGRLNLAMRGSGRIRPGQPSWDHIYPKPRTPDQNPVQLLACAACNNKRGNAPARAEHIALALRLLQEFRAHTQGSPGAPSGKAGKKERSRELRLARRAAGREGAKPDLVMMASAMFEALEQKRAFCSVRKAERKRWAARRYAPKGWSRDDEARLSARILAEREAEPSRAERNAESQAAAFRGIAGRAKANGDKATAFKMTQKAAAILEAVRGPKR